MVDNFKVSYVPGGSALNTMRVAQWFYGPKQSFGYLGAIGQDKNGDILQSEAAKSGLRCVFCVDDTAPTGKCACLITANGERSLVAHLAAANLFKRSHVTEPEPKRLIENARVIYVTGFFLTHSPDTALDVARVAASRNITFAMNISAPFLVQVPDFKKRVLALREYADFVFCNHHEAEALGEAMGWGSDLQVIAAKTAALPKANGARARRVVFTHGGEPAIMVGGDDAVSVFPVIPLAKGELVDENGAGDAYVGGFLAGLAAGWSLPHCFAAASYCAWVVVQRIGCTLPDVRPRKAHLGFTFAE